MSTFGTKLKEFFGFIEEGEEMEVVTRKESSAPAQKSFRGSLLNTTKTKHINLGQIQVEEPRIYEDSLTIATYLRDSRPVIVNLKYLDSPTGKRLIDFICGTAYAISGHMLKIAENIFLFTPANILIANSDEEHSFDDISQEDTQDNFLEARQAI